MCDWCENDDCQGYCSQAIQQKHKDEQELAEYRHFLVARCRNFIDCNENEEQNKPLARCLLMTIIELAIKYVNLDDLVEKFGP